MEKTKNASATATYRVSEETKAKISELMSSEKLSAEGLFTTLISAFEKENFANTDYGAAMQNDLDAWSMHSAALQQLYTNAVRSGIDAKEIVRKELSGRIEASEAALSGLKEKLDKANEEKKDLASQLEATKKALEETVKALDKAEEEAGQASENAEAWKNSINTLTAQLEESKDKVKEFDKISAELADVKAELLGAKAENKALNVVIEKFMKSAT